MIFIASVLVLLIAIACNYMGYVMGYKEGIKFAKSEFNKVIEESFKEIFDRQRDEYIKRCQNLDKETAHGKNDI